MTWYCVPRPLNVGSLDAGPYPCLWLDALIQKDLVPTEVRPTLAQPDAKSVWASTPM